MVYNTQDEWGLDVTISWYLKKHKRTQRFGNWIGFHPQVRVGRYLLCLVH
jgi:hypothetical protein